MNPEVLRKLPKPKLADLPAWRKLQQRVVNTMATGAAFGEIGLLTKSTYTSTVRALDHVALGVLDAADFRKTLLKFYAAARARKLFSFFIFCHTTLFFSGFRGGSSRSLCPAYARLRTGRLQLNFTLSFC